jgi:hypothetical protein
MTILHETAEMIEWGSVRDVTVFYKLAARTCSIDISCATGAYVMRRRIARIGWQGRVAELLGTPTTPDFHTPHAIGYEYVEVTYD